MTLRIGDRDPDRYHLVRALQLRILLRSPLHPFTLIDFNVSDYGTNAEIQVSQVL
jgi:hypothetical protein